MQIEDLFSVLRLGQHCSLIGDFREYGSQNSGSCRTQAGKARRCYSPSRSRSVRERSSAVRETSPKPSTLLGRREKASILTGLAGPSSLARFFERFAVLRFA